MTAFYNTQNLPIPTIYRRVWNVQPDATIQIRMIFDDIQSKEIMVIDVTNADADIVQPVLLTPITALDTDTQTRYLQSRITAKAIPQWAMWTQTDWQTYFDANMSTAQVATVTTISQARTMMNKQNLVIQNLVKLVIAMRDNQWPDL